MKKDMIWLQDQWPCLMATLVKSPLLSLGNLLHAGQKCCLWASVAILVPATWGKHSLCGGGLKLSLLAHIAFPLQESSPFLPPSMQPSCLLSLGLQPPPPLSPHSLACKPSLPVVVQQHHFPGIVAMDAV